VTGAVHTLLFYEPGHFHAALTLRNRNPRVAHDVHLYARPGPDRDKFLALIEAFNTRADQPTGWRVHVHAAGDPLESIIEERRGDVAVLAGRNDSKLEAIARLHAAGLNVLADKPWLVSGDALPFLDAATSRAPLAMDIMTERHEVIARLRERLVTNADVFGEFVRANDQPAIEIASIHHLFKMVNARALERPAWYYDVAVQGDGLTDIQSHLVDQAQWMVTGEKANDFDADIARVSARRWCTPVPLDLYRDSTGETAFAETLSAYVHDGVLELPCNGEIDYTLDGVRVRQRAEWGQREPPGTGDRHPATIRGTRATLHVRHGPETDFIGELDVEPAGGADVEPALRAATNAWQDAFPGLDLVHIDDGFRFVIPRALRTSHESHFAMVLERFLDYVDAGTWPAWLSPGIRMRYTLLARAQALAIDEPSKSPDAIR